MSVLEKLTEGIVHRDVGREGQAILTKWEKTGLLEGIGDDRTRQNMAVLLENQAKELLREASSMAAGDVEGFAAVAFPIVRRVFGGLIANELVSVQPMSLPSGLIFFLDFTKADGGRQGAAGESLYGGDRVASEITGGVNLSGRGDQGGFYNLSTGYTAATASLTQDLDVHDGTTGISVVTSGDGASLAGLDYDADLKARGVAIVTIAGTSLIATATGGAAKAQVDCGVPQSIEITKLNCAIDANGANNGPVQVAEMDDSTGDMLFILDGAHASFNALHDAQPGDNDNHLVARIRMVRRHTRLDEITSDGLRVCNGLSQVVFDLESVTDSGRKDVATGTLTTAAAEEVRNGAVKLTLTAAMKKAVMDALFADAQQLDAVLAAPIKDNLKDGVGLGSLVGTDQWGLEEPSPGTGKRGQGDDSSKNIIPEIDIKVDSVAVTAQTKKLKAKWTPELAQDLNAYHNLDAEVELTGILSEQIALEIDQEILGDLIRGATAGTMHWSRNPGKFLDRVDGTDLTVNGTAGPDFTGTVSEWYETLIETINDVSAQIHRKTLRGGANFLVCSPEVANILEFTSGFRARATHDQEKGQVGAVNVGSLSKKFDVYVDPYFLRNVILVGRKGSSFLESGFVYAPYVPLQTTPTIFGTEDFVPRKGVMTRYAKKMVRPDLYGIVVVQDLLG